MRSLFIAPHNDDEALFGAFTLMRYKPTVLVVTDSYIQAERGDKISMVERRLESAQAMNILGCDDLSFGGIRDTEITKDEVKNLLYFGYPSFDIVFAPMPYENGNPHHNLIGEVAKEKYGDRVIFYSTYTKDNLYMTGKTEIIPTPEELELKNKALQCYKSQLSLGSTRPHFEAVLGRSEWYD